MVTTERAISDDATNDDGDGRRTIALARADGRDANGWWQSAVALLDGQTAVVMAAEGSWDLGV